MKHILMLVAVAVIMLGCARGPTLPPANVDGELLQSVQSSSEIWDGPYQNWGEWTLYIDETHTQIDVVPKRQSRFHLNALKFLESYCPDCLEIVGFHNNGDGTIDLTVRITHPFPGMPEYTAFDMKGIVMFEGSHEFPDNLEKLPLYPQNFRASWRLMGDPELLNADGYNYRWSPWYDSGSEMPIFNYWEGKFSNGTPTANINGYLDFYSDPNRHMFTCDSSVSRTYHISLPTGPVVVGYAVEACWEPPTVTPVTNPAEDFPVTANQPEAYHFNIEFNDGNPITDPTCCNGSAPFTVHEGRIELDIWYYPPEFTDNYWVGCWTDNYNLCKPGCSGIILGGCDAPPNWACFRGNFKSQPDGAYQWIAFEYHVYYEPGEKVYYPAFDLFEVVVDLE